MLAEPFPISLKDCNIAPEVLHPENPLVILQGRMRSTADGWVVTLFLVNQQEERKRCGEPKDEVWLCSPGPQHRLAAVHRLCDTDKALSEGATITATGAFEASAVI